MVDSTNEPGPTFFSDYQIISIDGYRRSFPNFMGYCRQYISRLPPAFSTAVWKSFCDAAEAEIALENYFRLPRDYLMGLSEVCTSPLQLLTFARNERDRLQEASLQPVGVGKPREHIDLILTTSFSRPCTTETTITKQVVFETKIRCSCLLCAPLSRLSASPWPSTAEASTLSKLLRMDVNMFYPCLPPSKPRIRVFWPVPIDPPVTGYTEASPDGTVEPQPTDPS